MKRLFLAAALTAVFGAQAGPSTPIGHVMSSRITINGRIVETVNYLLVT